MAKEFDLSQFETIDLAALTVQTPRGEDLIVDGKPVVINLYGPGSKQFVNAKYRLDNAVQARSIAMLRGKGSKNAAEEARQQQAEFYAAVTASVENFPVSPIDIYLNPKLNYITEQVEKFLSDTENFMPASPTK